MSDLKPNSLAVKAPWLKGEWSSKNLVDFEDVSYGSHTKYWWECPRDGWVYEAAPCRRTARNPSVCPKCPRKPKKVTAANSLATKAPHLEKEWHPDNKKRFEDVSCGSHIKYKWLCDIKHVWTASPNSRTHLERATGCPDCTHKRVSELNSLATKAPWLEKEWHPDNKERFDEVSFSSNKKYKWRCPEYGHPYLASPSERTRSRYSSGCTACPKWHSKAEVLIFDAVNKKYSDAMNGKRKLLQNGRFELDIYVPSLKKAIEYDGTYWHSRPIQKEKDQRKNEQCVQAGIQLLRISEAEYEADREGTIKRVLEWLAAP